MVDMMCLQQWQHIMLVMFEEFVRDKAPLG